jgi:hypothetical protein
MKNTFPNENAHKKQKGSISKKYPLFQLPRKRQLVVVLKMKLSSAVGVVVVSAAMGLYQRAVFAEEISKRFCCLCNRCAAPLLDRWDLYLNDSGLSCGKLDSNMFNPGNDSKAGNDVCKNLQFLHRDTCCNPETRVQSVPQAPTPAPTYGDNVTYGKNEVCNLCLNGSKPSKPFTMITSNQITGLQTCDSIYHLGLTRNIGNALCYPLQLELKGPCGCNNNQPKPTTQPTTSPKIRGTSSSPISSPRAALPLSSPPPPPFPQPTLPPSNKELTIPSIPKPLPPAPAPAQKQGPTGGGGAAAVATKKKAKNGFKEDTGGRVRGHGSMMRM